ncbi:hypothetical protein F183_A50330 [Bryobacterales bacterium F-183]|nr:hypothetical protein F183_A50330 [Bryobacterales bacterium F-183]
MAKRQPQPQPQWQYAFEGRIVQHDLGNYRYSVIFLPEDLNSQEPFSHNKRLRFKGIIGAHPVSAAWQPVRGRLYCMLSKALLAKTRYRPGDLALVRFNLESLDAVDLPEILQVALADDKKLAAAWKTLTAGKQRGYAHMLRIAKRPETQIKRLVELRAQLLNSP